MDFLGALFDPGKRDLARLRKVIDQINALEPKIKQLSESQFRERIGEMRTDVQAAVEKHGWPAKEAEAVLSRNLPEVFALTREAALRTVGLRHFDVQLIGAMVLQEGRIAEQKTGEGKTMTAVPALVLNSLTGRGAHLITANDYLARHGAEWMGPIYRYLGISVGVLQHDTRGEARRNVYRQDVVYGTNNEFGFDYLRDNMVIHVNEMVQRELNFGIVDECDSILIDEARTPLIISGSSNEDTSMYVRVDGVIKRLKGEDITGQEKTKDIFEQVLRKKQDDDAAKAWDYEFDRKNHSASLTPKGIARVEKELADVLQVDPHAPEEGLNLFAFINTEIAHYVQQSLRAHALYQHEVEYVVKDGEVIIVDEFTGRLMFGRRYSEGLHQAIEAKEGLSVKPESQTLATITIQNYFRLYHKLAGMTGTAKTEEEEFRKIYGMDVLVIPTNRPVTRKDMADVVYKSEQGKFNAIAEDVYERWQKQQPVLVGTTSIEKSERLAALFRQKGIPAEVLNAKYHEKEAAIVAQAGRPGAITIATNMAGRGTDIILGGNAEFAARDELRGQGVDPDENDELLRGRIAELKPEYEKNAEVVKAAGGLYVIGSERHESRRIDNQLRGRSGRQGDPGESRFFLSLKDDLMKMYGGERVEQLMDWLKIEEDMPIESGMLTKSIENAQKKVEGRNFDARKHVLSYDDVMNKQRKVIYDERRRILLGGDLREQTLGFLKSAVNRTVETHTVRNGREYEIDYPALTLEIQQSFPVGILDPEQFDGQSPEQIVDWLGRRVLELYEDKERELGRFVLAHLANIAAEIHAQGQANGGGQVQVAIPDMIVWLANQMELKPDVWGAWFMESAQAMEQIEDARQNGTPLSPELLEIARQAGAPLLREQERVITLRSIDENWIEHLNLLDHLRSGVSLRGYGQQDPVVVYAQEAFAEFENFKQQIELDVVRKIFLVRVPEPQRHAPPAPPQQERSAYNVRGMSQPSEQPRTDETGKRVAETRTAAKIGRNTKCYCGSGKKYKQCHLNQDGGNPPDDWVERYQSAYGEAPRDAA
jgi:preprotein translocase subunit SecA